MPVRSRKYLLPLAAAVALSTAGCSLKTYGNRSDEVRLGYNRMQVVKAYGKPDAADMYYDDQGRYCEVLYYKYGPYGSVVTVACYFVDKILVRQKVVQDVVVGGREKGHDTGYGMNSEGSIVSGGLND